MAPKVTPLTITDLMQPIVLCSSIDSIKKMPYAMSYFLYTFVSIERTLLKGGSNHFEFVFLSYRKASEAKVQ